MSSALNDNQENVKSSDVSSPHDLVSKEIASGSLTGEASSEVSSGPVGLSQSHGSTKPLQVTKEAEVLTTTTVGPSEPVNTTVPIGSHRTEPDAPPPIEELPQAENNPENPPERWSPHISQFQLNLWTLVLGGVAVVTLLLTIVYTWSLAVTTGPLTKWVPSPTTAFRALRISTDVVAIVLTAFCSSTLEVIVWANASTRKGITLSSFLGISSSTGFLGLICLLGWRKNPNGTDHHRMWVCLRYAWIIFELILGYVYLQCFSR